MDRPFLEGDKSRYGKQDACRHQKVYLFFFVLVFTATLSIYRASSPNSDGDLQGNWAVIYEEADSPTRLDDATDVLGGGNEKVTSDVGAKKNNNNVASKAKGSEKKKGPKDDEPTPSKKKKPMNVVMLYADDWRHDSLVIFVGTLAAKFQPDFSYLTLFSGVFCRASREGIQFTHRFWIP